MVKDLLLKYACVEDPNYLKSKPNIFKNYSKMSRYSHLDNYLVAT